MGVGIGGSSAGGNMDLTDKGVCEEAAGKNCAACFREANLQTMYMHGEDVGIQ